MQGLRLTLLLALALFLTPAGSAAAKSGVETTGDALRIAIPAAAYGATFLADDAEGRRQLYFSFAANMAATYALKYAVNKERPNGEPYSFPSGHTSVSFQGASFVHIRYGLMYAGPLYLGAAFTGYSRVDAEKHYVEDVLAGAALGVLCSMLLADRHHDLALMPFVEPGALGLRVDARW